MGHDPFLIDLMITLLSAVVIVSAFRRLNLSSIVGYLIAGLAIGPHAFALIRNLSTVELLGEFGVVFLLFTIGLKIPVRRLQILSKFVFGLGFLQVVTTTLIFMAIAMKVFNVGIEPALVISSALALSSTAIGLQLLTERGELAQPHGKISFSILLAQDLSVVVLLVLITSIGETEQSVLVSLRNAGVNALIVLIAIILLGRLILRPVFRAVAPLKNPEILTALSLLIVLLTSLATDAVGLSKELGAFIAGLLISETEYRHQVEADIKPFYGLLLGLFFMTVGMKIDIGLIISHAQAVFILLLVMVVLKGLIIALLALLFGESRSTCIKSGFMLATGGEFAFVLIGPAMEKGLLAPEAGQVIFVTVALSMACTPFLVAMGMRLGQRYARVALREGSQKLMQQIDELKNHVIIAGYGRVGNMIVKLLDERVIPYVIIENNMVRVHRGRAEGLPIYYGDACRDVVWKSLGADRAIACVIGLTDQKDTLRASLMVRRQFPTLSVNARVADDRYLEKMTQANIHVVKPENLAPSLRLASQVLLSAGMNDTEVTQIIEQFRRDYLNSLESKTEDA